MEKSRIEIISRRIVKPSSPTPNHKRRLILSLLDQNFSTFAPIIYCYNISGERPLTTFSLKKSLSKTLELFYAFAGQFNDDFTSIECNDHGAYFLEARISSKLSDFLRIPDPKTVTELLPFSDQETQTTATRYKAVTLVQLTAFSCGGIAVAVQVSHKIGDAYSISRFVKSWAAITAGKSNIAAPVFAGPALFPPPLSPIKRIPRNPPQARLKSRRLVFSTAKLAELKKNIRKNGGPDFISPSTLEAVSSLLLRCVVAASGASALLQMVNLREKLDQQDIRIGNMAWPRIVSSGEPRSSMNLHEIAIVIRLGLSEFFNAFDREALVSMASRIAGEEDKLVKEGISLSVVSFMSSIRPYKTDFGFGEPAWVTTPLFYDKRFPMMHSKSGREIEVWATLEEDVMAKFESNEELLGFASFDVPKDNARGHSRL